MKKFKVKVTNSGVIITPNGRQIRTPTELNIKEDKLEEYKVQFRAKGLTYKIIETTNEEDNDKIDIPSITETVVVEELINTKKESGEPKNFLDKLIYESEE